MMCKRTNDNSSHHRFNKGMDTSHPNGHDLPLLNVITQHMELTRNVNSNDPINIDENSQYNGCDIADAVSPITVDMACDIGVKRLQTCANIRLTSKRIITKCK